MLPKRKDCPFGWLSRRAKAAANTNARFGLEIKAAIPDGPDARVTLRNVKIGETATLQAFATCILTPGGIRVVDGPASSRVGGAIGPPGK